MTVECDILFHARLHLVCVLPPLYQGGGVALSYIHPDPLPALCTNIALAARGNGSTAVELSESQLDRSADFSPLPPVLGAPEGSGLKSALLNSMAVGNGRGAMPFL